MMTPFEKPIMQEMAKINLIIDELEQAFTDERWEDVEKLIKTRTHSTEQILTTNLSADVMTDIEKLISKIKQQDNRIILKAKAIQEASGQELIARNNHKKSMDAYKT